jgi:hypothetical protein
MAKEVYILKESVYLYDEDLFGDSEEHLFDVKCYDGYAIATRCKDEDSTNIEQVRLEYYTLAEVLANEILSNHVLRYNGLYDLSPSDINYGDIMMAYGKITEVIK